MKNIHADKMIEAAKEKQNMIEKFLKLTKEQTQALDENNYEYLLKLINEKQTIIEYLNSSEFDINENLLHGSLQIIDLQTKETMSKVMALDNTNIELLKKDQAEIFRKLKNVKKSRTAHSLYRGKNIGVEGILLDQKQ